MTGMPAADRRLLRVRVKPRSAKPGISSDDAGGLTVCVHAPPDRGEANREACQLLAGHFGLPVSRVRILRGASSRLKLVELSGSGRGDRGERNS